MRMSRADRIYNIVNNTLLGIICVIVIYPLYYILIASFSNYRELATGNIYFWPLGFSLKGYIYMMTENPLVWTGYANTVFYTICATSYNLILTIPAAYVLTKKDLPGRNGLATFFFITMYFSGGMLPTYLNIKNLGLFNTRMVMIIGSGVSCWNLIVTRSFFTQNIPEELYAAAHIDGASEFRCFFSIALPLSGPILAIMALYYGVGHWNSYYSAMMYLSKQQLYPLQLVMRNILISNSMALSTLEMSTMDADEIRNAVEKANMILVMKYALIFISCFPLLAVYPFVQKYFIKGALTGSIKG
jgi:putative aldouronate transport system permease protein